MSSADLLSQVSSFSTVDRELAALLGGDRPFVRATVALLSHALRSGHSCLQVQSLADLPLVNDAGELVLQLPDRDTLLSELTEGGIMTSALPDGSGAAEFRPIVFDGARLYFRRYFDHEGTIAQGIERLAGSQAQDLRSFDERLAAYFSDASGRGEQQREAVRTALCHRVSLITGGPGTGKTTTVVKLLALLLERAIAEQASLRIALLAPTGKAAERLLRATSSAATRLALNPEIVALLPTESRTIHRALGVIPGVKTRFRHDRGNPLPFDLVVVDEVSMVDLALMGRLIDALPAPTRVVFLGDSDQLTSVDAGSVLSELTEAARALAAAGLPWSFGHATLRESYRFAGSPGIMELAESLRTGDPSRTLGALASAPSEVQFVDASDYESWSLARVMREKLEDRFRESLRAASAEEALSRVEKFQVLCALRGGPFGARAINDWVRGLASGSRRGGGDGVNYAGRRILITENEPRVGLYNGDIGVLWPGPRGQLLAYFPGASGRVRSFSLAELPAHEDAFAITIHKSQGSEYDEIVLVLPAEGSTELMTRELLYTGVTRARVKVSLLAGRALLLAAVERRAERHSGLSARLLQVARMSSSRL